MEEPSGNPPPTPPQAPLPVIPAANASTPFVRSRPNFGQQAARASWIAPLIVIALSLFTLPRGDDNAQADFIVACVKVFILFVGGVLGLIALLGMRKWGREGVLLPALVGTVIFGFVIFALVSSFRAAGRLKLAQQQQARQDEIKRLEKEGFDAAINSDGWLGFLPHRGAMVTLTTMPDSTPFVAEMLANFQTPVSVLVLGVDNSRGDASLTIDPAGAVVHLTDGSSRPMPDLVGVLRTTRRDAEEAVRAFGPPLGVTPRKQLIGKFLFLPPKTDPVTIAHVSLKIDGEPVDVPGRFFTAQEKHALHEQAQKQNKQQSSSIPEPPRIP